MADGAASHWTVRLEGARDATKRTRLAFIAVTVISVAIVIAVFNSAISWNRIFLFYADFPPSAVTSEVDKAIIKAWVKSTHVSVSLLGVDFEVSDAAFLGSTSLYILTLWFFYSIRRENHLIGPLLIDASHNQDAETRAMVFHGVASQMIFVAITGSDKPIDSLTPGKPSDSGSFVLRATIVALFYLPVFTIALIIVTDVWSLFRESPARFPHDVLHSQIKTWGEIFSIIGWEAIALFLGTVTFFMCRGALSFQRATGDVLREFYTSFIATEALARTDALRHT